MSYENYERFDEEMTDILSSGSAFEMSDWHKKSITNLFDGMDRDRIVEDLNVWYNGQDVEDIREGELDIIADLIDGSVVNGSVDSKITFS